MTTCVVVWFEIANKVKPMIANAVTTCVVVWIEIPMSDEKTFK